MKNFGDYQIQNKARQTDGLPLEISLKVRDTIAGLIGAYSRILDRRGISEVPAWLNSALRLLTEREPGKLKVVAWLEDGLMRLREPLRRREEWQTNRKKRLQQRLAWLTTPGNISVEAPTTSPGVPGVRITPI